METSPGGKRMKVSCNVYEGARGGGVPVIGIGLGEMRKVGRGEGNGMTPREMMGN